MRIINWFIEGFKMSWRDFRHNTPWKFVFGSWIVVGLISFITGIQVDVVFIWYIILLVSVVAFGALWTIADYLIHKKTNKN